VARVERKDEKQINSQRDQTAEQYSAFENMNPKVIIKDQGKLRAQRNTS